MEWLAAAALTALVMVGMAAGLLAGRQGLRGSCGGAAPGSCPCGDAQRRRCAGRAER